MRLYKCPPELAGGRSDVYLTSPLVRWSRHRELLAVMTRMRKDRPRLRRFFEIFLNVGACLGLISVASLIPVVLDTIFIDSSYFILKNDLDLFLWPLFYLQIFCLVYATIALLLEISCLILSMPPANLLVVEKSILDKLKALSGLNKQKSKIINQDAYISGLSFRDIVAVSTLDGSRTYKDQVWRWQYAWPAFASFFIAFLAPHQTFRSLACLNFLLLFWVFHVFVLLCACSATTSSLGVLVNYVEIEPTQKFGKYCKLIAKRLIMPIGHVLTLLIAVWILTRAWRPTWPSAYRYSHLIIIHQREAIILFFSIILLCFRGRIQSYIRGGSASIQREIMRQGEVAFREYVQRNAESPPGRGGT
jgi:hypothetical protein